LGDLSGAEEAAARLVKLAPENVHALANLVRCAALRGERETAAAWGARLAAFPAVAPEYYPRLVEAHTFLQDDPAVLAAFAAAEPALATIPDGDAAFMLHLAAVAAMRLGNASRATYLWRESRKRNPALDLPKRNLDELRLPTGDRDAPFAFSLPYFGVTPSQVELISQSARPSGDSDDNQANGKLLLAFRKALPHLPAMASLLFSRGDNMSRRFALLVAGLWPDSRLKEALRDFALGQDGKDELRVSAASASLEAGLIGGGAVSLWLQGAWRTVILLSMDVQPDPWDEGLDEEVAEWYDRALEASIGDDLDASRLQIAALAERLPQDPRPLDILISLHVRAGDLIAAADTARLLKSRSEHLIFETTAAAFLAVHAGDLEGAEELLRPLPALRTCTESEFSSLCRAQVALFSARGQDKLVTMWLDLWDQTGSFLPDRYWIATGS
jgi:hypothetical protein